MPLRHALVVALLVSARSAGAQEAAGDPGDAPSEAPSAIYVDDWPSDLPPPAGYRRVTEPRTWAVKVGTNVFTAAYLAIAITSALEVKSSGDSSYWWGVAPLAGPFVMLRYATAPYISAALWADGALQGAGALLAVFGVAFPTTHLVRHVGVSWLSAVPVLSPEAVGLRLRGAF